MIDLHVHVLGEGEYGDEEARQRFLEFQRKALKKGVRYLGLAEHTYAVDKCFYDMVMKTKRENGLIILLGTEADYGVNSNMALKLAKSVPLDYIIGSVHELNGWAFDLETERWRYGQWDLDELFSYYFRHVQEMVSHGNFDIIGHLDLIKKFNFLPRTPIADLASPLLAAISKVQATVEVNTSGWFKPVDDCYPDNAILKRLFELNVPVTLGSDAHEPDEVGRELERAKDELKRIGYTRLAVFRQRKRYFISL